MGEIKTVDESVKRVATNATPLLTELLRVDRMNIAAVLSQVSTDLLSGNVQDASRRLTDVISILRWDGKPS